MENINDFCYVNIKNEIIIEYKLLKNQIDINNYLFIIEKIKEVFNKLLFEKEKLLIVHLNLECLNLNDITKHYDFLCLFVDFLPLCRLLFVVFLRLAPPSINTLAAAIEPKIAAASAPNNFCINPLEPELDAS